LKKIVADRRPDALQAWYEETNVRNIGRVIDRATAAAVGNRKRIEARRRNTYVERLTTVTKLVVKLFGTQPPPAESTGITLQVAAKEAGSIIVENWAGVVAAVDALDDAERALGGEALTDLEVVRRWAA